MTQAVSKAASLGGFARQAVRVACAIAVGLGSGLLLIGFLLTFDTFFSRILEPLPGNPDGLSLLAVPPILAVVCVANSRRGALRTWVVSALVIAALCLLVSLLDMN